MFSFPFSFLFLNVSRFFLLLLLRLTAAQSKRIFIRFNLLADFFSFSLMHSKTHINLWFITVDRNANNL